MSELLSVLGSALSTADTPDALTSGLVGPIAFMGFGFQEILLVGFVALLVFGGNLPDVMRQLGRTYGRLRSSLNELSAPVRDEMRQLRDVPAPRRTPTGYDTASEDPEDIPPLEEESETEDEAPEITTTPGFEPPADTLPRGGVPPEDAAAEDKADPSAKPKPGSSKELDEPPPV